MAKRQVLISGKSLGMTQIISKTPNMHTYYFMYYIIATVTEA